MSLSAQRGAVPLARKQVAPRPRDDVRVCREAAERCACVTAGFFKVDPQALFRTTRGSADEAFARQVWMGGLVLQLGFASSLVGKAIGRDPATVDHAVRIIEALRGSLDVDDLCDILGADGVVNFLGGVFGVEQFLESSEPLIDDLYEAFAIVAVRGSAYCAERDRLKVLQHAASAAPNEE